MAAESNRRTASDSPRYYRFDWDEDLPTFTSWYRWDEVHRVNITTRKVRPENDHISTQVHHCLR